MRAKPLAKRTIANVCYIYYRILHVCNTKALSVRKWVAKFQAGKAMRKAFAFVKIDRVQAVAKGLS